MQGQGNVIHHVRAHTGARDEHSEWNKVADMYANHFRQTSLVRYRPHLFNEERVIAFIYGDPVHGDFRTWAQRAAARVRREDWAKGSGHVSDVISQCMDGVAPLCKAVRSHGDSEELVLLEALCSRAPCGHSFSRTRPDPPWPKDGWGCFSCGHGSLETIQHVLMCSATDGVRRDVIASAIRSAVGIEIAGQQGQENGQAAGRPLTSVIQKACNLARQLDTTAASRDPLFVEWCSWDSADQAAGANGYGWGKWEGQFVLAMPEQQHEAGALRKAIRSYLKPTVDCVRLSGWLLMM